MTRARVCFKTSRKHVASGVNCLCTVKIITMSFWRCLVSQKRKIPCTGEKINTLYIPRRWKRVKKSWQAPQTQRKREPSFHALRFFDDNYGHQFGSEWSSIRLGLLSSPRYGTLVNNYGVSEKTEEALQRMGAKDFVQPAANKLEKTADEILGSDSYEETAEMTSSDFSSLSDEREMVDSSQLPLGHLKPFETSESKLDTLGDATENLENKKSWEEKYIVAPGYEAKMEVLMSSDAIGGHKLDSNLDSNQAVPDIDIRLVQKPLAISTHLKCYVFDAGNSEQFPPSKMDSSGSFLQYYTMDAASMLPVIAMNITPGDLVLDLCAAPGGKSLAILQTMLPGGLVANEPESPRRRRLQGVLRSYVGFDRQSGEETLRITAEDGRRWGEMEPDTYDKVLVDVPCTTDRLSANSNDNSIFAVNRTKERWNLPNMQRDLLCAGLRAVKPGGDVVYSTCTLSRQQNDAVVESAIYQCQTESDMEVVVVDLSPLTRCLDDIFKFCDRMQHGQLVLPNVSRNFGPTYFCRLLRVK